LHSRFQTFTLFWMLHAFFWVIQMPGNYPEEGIHLLHYCNSTCSVSSWMGIASFVLYFGQRKKSHGSIPSLSSCYCHLIVIFLHGTTAPSGPRPHHWGFMITLRHATLGSIPLDKWSAHYRDLYLTTHK
jgi:hypothetical protein